jgi:hypothetical protein
MSDAVDIHDLLLALRAFQVDWRLVGVTAIVEIDGGKHSRVSVVGDNVPVLTIVDEHDNVLTLDPELLA